VVLWVCTHPLSHGSPGDPAGVSESKSLTLDVRIPSTVLTDDEGGIADVDGDEEGLRSDGANALPGPYVREIATELCALAGYRCGGCCCCCCC